MSMTAVTFSCLFLPFSGHSGETAELEVARVRAQQVPSLADPAHTISGGDTKQDYLVQQVNGEED